jgi:hypothetical protein
MENMAESKAERERKAREAEENAAKDPALMVPAHREGLVDFVKEHGITDPATQVGPQGESFYAPHLTGSGTILPDGTYGPPLPDPNVLAQEDPALAPDVPERTTELDFPEGLSANDETRRTAEARSGEEVRNKPASK